MDVILVSRKYSRTRTYTLRLPDLMLLAVATLLAVAALSASVTHSVLLRSSQPRAAAGGEAVLEPSAGQHAAPVADVARLGIRLSQMQSQLVRLDTLSNRLTRMVGFHTDALLQDDEVQPSPLAALPPPVMTLAGVTRQLDVLFRELDERRDALGALESLFSLDDVRRKLLPTSLPLAIGLHSSDFGWRIDPFTGERTYHEGIDFMAERGTPIRAAAGGVVVYSALHPQYGNMIEIDHGNGLVTRYAHAAKRIARVGDVVARGAEIGEVGSTGRATGNHLHFEVRRNGAPMNPAQFLGLRG